MAWREDSLPNFTQFTVSKTHILLLINQLMIIKLTKEISFESEHQNEFQYFQVLKKK